MDNWRMVLANWSKSVEKESVERIEWYKRNIEMKQIKKTMIKKHEESFLRTEHVEYRRKNTSHEGEVE